MRSSTVHVHLCFVLPLLMSTQLTTEAPASNFGITTRTPKPEVHRIGVTQGGEWYLYGDTPTSPRQTIEALATPRILDIKVVVRAQRSEFGERRYLDVTMLGETPNIRYVLSLPCRYADQRTGTERTQYSVRSLLGCLMQLDLPNTPLKLEPSRGAKATFTNVYLDPAGLQPVNSPAIGAELADLQLAVDCCRASLGLPPQFNLASAADTTTAASSDADS
jgi:hypothetical protein